MRFKPSQETTVSNAIELGRKARLATERWQPLPYSQKHLLGDLASLFVVLQRAQTHIEDRALMSLHEGTKGILISLLTGFHYMKGGLRPVST